MRRRFTRGAITLALALLAMPALAAAAEPDDFGGHPGSWDQSPRELYAFRGEVVSVDREAGTIAAQVEHLNSHGPRVPERFAATIRTDTETEIRLNGEEATIGDLQPGDELFAGIVAERGLTAEQALERPARVVAAHRLPAIYGFAGRVRAVDAGAGTVTLAVRYTLSSARTLEEDPEERRILTFRTDANTEIVRNGRRAELAELEPGDLAGVAVVTRRHASLEEVLATPARFVVAASRRYAARHGMRRRGEATLGGRAVRWAR